MDVPMYCSIHGLSLEFFCFDDKQRICSECARNQHKTHKFNFVNVCASINKELLDYLKQRSSQLQLERKMMLKQSLREFKTVIRAEVLSMKQQSISAIEEACGRILH